ncbi:DUF805 domain-containing protein [Gryllotalpicola sp.]|uniref:DUF805 domain-containing protein n=1 Tax=Gryllotalpicola sp. TaxID=1932787 RepID=UPI00261FAAA4|nr:DUF805 domain-containing protein [Gryllotalpicola sp.]
MTIPTLPARPATDDQPLYGATFGQAFTRFWQRYALFYGRASRSEFWWWFLVNVLVGGALSALSGNGTNHSNAFFSILSAPAPPAAPGPPAPPSEPGGAAA